MAGRDLSCRAIGQHLDELAGGCYRAEVDGRIDRDGIGDSDCTVSDSEAATSRSVNRTPGRLESLATVPGWNGYGRLALR